MKKRILIANRGEIAVRVMRTAKEMGFETIAIYAEDDKDLKFVALADFAISLGAGAPTDTYLNQKRILEIAKEHQAWGIHPGYGFLSENADFCTLVEKSGLVFIGADPKCMKIMGDKRESKIYLEKFKIPLIPGYHGTKQDSDYLLAEAIKIGFPILIKATAGGGGKGMRIVNDKKDFLELLDSAKSEAKKSFSNDQVLLEKFLTTPRHIEVQVMSDTHGNHLHFFERECSIQRRYQKVIEEAPAPAISVELRDKICETAVKISSGINYRGAGTLEFILDQDDSFYFLEMNTRLQVEHPVTEMITGFDLVRLQLEVAQGNKLTIKQENIKIQGHALECRIYAENPDNNFLPTTGTIELIGSSIMDNVRIETGYRDGNEVNINYDPMLAKVIVKGNSRAIAITKMNQALNDFPFFGVKTNRDYLKRILRNDNFKNSNIDTNFISNNELAAKDFTNLDNAHLIAAHLFSNNKKTKKSNTTDTGLSSWDQISNFRNV